MTVFATRGTQRPRVLADEISYQCAINRILLETTRPANPSRIGMLTVSELKEMRQAYLTGESPEEFAARLQGRDAAAPEGDSPEEFAERLQESATTEPEVEFAKPIDLPKPLSLEHQRVIDLLREHHDHTGRPLVLCESEFYITLRIPMVPRLSYGGM